MSQVNEVEGHETGAETFVASAQSPIQQELISELSTDAAVVVEGPFRSYIAKQLQTYYVLRTDTTQRYKRYQEVEQDEDDSKCFNFRADAVGYLIFARFSFHNLCISVLQFAQIKVPKDIAHIVKTGCQM